MEHRELLFLVTLLLISSVSCHGKSNTREVYYDAYHIDCGAANASEEYSGLVVWNTDDGFIETGQNFLLTTSNQSTPMNSLRFFPTGLRNCYKIKFSDKELKVIFRAGFFYGNYDRIGKPPSFDLEIDGNLWSTVTTSTSTDEPIYYELIYKLKGGTSQVCLVRTYTDEVPFISSLEATLIMYGSNMYKLMDPGKALHHHSRINYGANKTIEQYITPFSEQYNRIWKSQEMAEYPSIFRGSIPNVSFDGENKPPMPVMVFAIQATNISNSIQLRVDFSPQISSTAYFVFYFMDPEYRYPPNQTSKVEVLVDGVQFGATDVPEATRKWDPYHVVSMYPVHVKSFATVTISPAPGSTLPPILNAMEVFTVTPMSNAGFISTRIPSYPFSFLIFLEFILVLWL